MSRRPSALALLAIASVVLGGCVTLLPRQAPAMLYRFGAASPVETTGRGPGEALVISTALPAAAAGDMILTSSGRQMAYVGNARWVSPASELFQADVVRGLAPVSPPGGGRLKIVLDLFEVERGTPSAPRVRLRARMAFWPGHGETPVLRDLDIGRDAGSGAMVDIVAAYDAAADAVIRSARDLVTQAPAAPHN